MNLLCSEVQKQKGSFFLVLSKKTEERGGGINHSILINCRFQQVSFSRFGMASKCTKDTSNIDAPIVMVSI